MGLFSILCHKNGRIIFATINRTMKIATQKRLVSQNVEIHRCVCVCVCVRTHESKDNILLCWGNCSEMDVDKDIRAWDKK